MSASIPQRKRKCYDSSAKASPISHRGRLIEQYLLPAADSVFLSPLFPGSPSVNRSLLEHLKAASIHPSRVVPKPGGVGGGRGRTVYSCHAWPLSYDHRRSHPYNAGMEQGRVFTDKEGLACTRHEAP